MQTLTDLAEALDGGLCRTAGYDPDIWTEYDLMPQARRLCAACPVLMQCLDYSTDPRTEVQTGAGVWGGLPAARRRAMRNARVLNLSIDDRYQPVTIPSPRAASN